MLNIEEIKESFKNKYWGNLEGSSLSFALAKFLEQQKQSSLIITANVKDATLLAQELPFFAPSLQISYFSDWEILPYDRFSPAPDIISERLENLYRIQNTSTPIFIIAISTLLQRLAPVAYIKQYTFLLKLGEKINLESLRNQLQKTGYSLSPQVIQHGEYTIRGNLIDIFPMGSMHAYRIELLDEEVESIRIFDPNTQLSIKKIDAIRILPAHEFPLSKEALSLFQYNWNQLFKNKSFNSHLYQDIVNGLYPPGIEYYLPLFFEATASFLDYLPPKTTLIHIGPVHPQAQFFWKEIQKRYEANSHDIQHPILEPSHLFFTVEELFHAFKAFPNFFLHTEPVKKGFNYPTKPALNFNRNVKNFIAHTLQSVAQERVLFCVHSLGRRESLISLLNQQEIFPKIYETWNSFLEDTQNPIGIIISPIEKGFSWADPPIHIITEIELFGQNLITQKKASTDLPKADFYDIAELKPGDLVVHLEQGIGRYRGLELLHINNSPGEYLSVEYAGGDKIYIPVASLHLIHRYNSTHPESIVLNKLGTEQWQKSKKKALEKIKDVAAELLDLYAKRSIKSGFSFNFPKDSYIKFASEFPFETTLDQQKAIDAVIEDMTSGKIMDRLICGDVGFGKTEVAMRAAFIAVYNEKQVAILVPTTLLAQQHYQNFCDRFANWPIQIEVLSRFRSTKEQSNSLERLAEGKIDIIIGTHQLLQSLVKFKNLGLVIIDEEHRFGVQQKEKLKTFSAAVDLLTLTATPIPRTLNMALTGMRDLSIIATPPAKRLSIKTFVQEYQPALVREAILRELFRGGQIYYIYNDITSIERKAQELQTWLPQARISIAHAQMREKDLERIMIDFYHQRNHILICTTIIETGIDIPSANTIIIERADKLGLAQLHQLRGRVGRSYHQAYAYLLIPSEEVITKDAKKRLEAIASLEHLGAGFALATQDLEIRGAGELLGEEQSGSIQAIGFNLYMDLLNRTIKSLKSESKESLAASLQSITNIELQIPALIPDTYIVDIHERLIFYKRIADAQSEDQLQLLRIEMLDRFGALPDYTKNLFAIARYKLQAYTLGIEKIEGNAHNIHIYFVPEPAIYAQNLIELLQKSPQEYQLDTKHNLHIKGNFKEPQQRMEVLEKLLYKTLAL